MAAGAKLNRTAKVGSPAAGSAKVIHLYGLTRAAGPSTDSLRAVKGVDGAARVEPIGCGGFICWVSRVPEPDFGQNLEQKMQDLDWLAAVTTRHQQAISAIAQAADMLPARFGIEFLNEKSLRSHVESREAALETDFQRIQGKEEWGVKVFALPSAPAPKKKIRSGKEYLEAKSALISRGAGASKTDFTDFEEALATVADEVAEGGKLAAARRDLRFQKTVLIKRGNRKKLENLVRTYSKKWKDQFRVECTGPWPPFSFVSQPAASE